MGMDAVTLTAIGSILGGGAALASATGMFGGKDQPTQTAPEIAKPTVMPIPDDDAAKRAKMRQAGALQQRKGRQSTILSEPVSSDLLGG